MTSVKISVLGFQSKMDQSSTAENLCKISAKNLANVKSGPIKYASNPMEVV